MDKDRKRGLRRAEKTRQKSESARKIKNLLSGDEQWCGPDAIHTAMWNKSRIHLLRIDEGKTSVSRKSRNWDYGFDDLSKMRPARRRMESMNQELAEYRQRSDMETENKEDFPPECQIFYRVTTTDINKIGIATNYKCLYLQSRKDALAFPKSIVLAPVSKMAIVQLSDGKHYSVHPLEDFEIISDVATKALLRQAALAKLTASEKRLLGLE